MHLALLGCGPRALRLAAVAVDLGHVVAVCADPSRAQARRTASRLRTTAAARLVDAASGVDAVIAADPSPGLAAALRALKNGVPVFWNAPLTHDPRLARRLLDAAQSAGSLLAPAYPSRACPEYAAAAAQMASGAIGPVGFVRVHRRAAHAGSAVKSAALDSLAGDIDFIATTLGRVDTVFAQLVRRRSVDSALLTLTLARGPIVQLAANATTDAPRATVECCGSTGMIQFVTNQPILSLDSAGRGRRIATSPLSPEVSSRRLAAFLSAAHRRMGAPQLAHERHVVRIVEAALSSARTGRAVKVPR